MFESLRIRLKLKAIFLFWWYSGIFLNSIFSKIFPWLHKIREHDPLKYPWEGHAYYEFLIENFFYHQPFHFCWFFFSKSFKPPNCLVNHAHIPNFGTLRFKKVKGEDFLITSKSCFDGLLIVCQSNFLMKYHNNWLILLFRRRKLLFLHEFWGKVYLYCKKIIIFCFYNPQVVENVQTFCDGSNLS